MASPTETTFKDLQMDERYKRLERTLKMVLLKNTDNGNSGTWQSISSINGDNLDTSCAAMSVQSSRVGSVVLASSTNLRNIMTRREQSFPLSNNLATSSENQFPMNRDSDSIMMPPPRMPCPSSGRSKRSDADNKRAPLSNVPCNPGRNEGAFTRSTPTNSVSSSSKCLGSPAGNPPKCFVDRSDYNCRNTWEHSDPNARTTKPQERLFLRWRVMLNDKAQLIIKGTLECGKIARSKPVIRRLAATSVQSIFKHTYHLRGNLIDERNELPEYVRGKFYNGFPDDWENVYQVWRNFVTDGSRLSFRWPTLITDSDDDIKSEITDITYRPRFERSSRSPRKRARPSKLSNSSSIAIVDNDPDKNNRHSSQNNTSEISLENSIKSSDNLPKNRSIRSIESVGENPKIVKNKSPDDSTSTNPSGNQRAIGNSLKDIIQEDKLNIIIENLTSKNCSLEYIHKIVEMFECMKYVVSYQSTESNDSKNSIFFNDAKESSQTPAMKNPSFEETSAHQQSLPRSASNRSAIKSPPSLRHTSSIMNNSHRDRYGVRRKLTKEDYGSSESENDYYEERERTLNSSRFHERNRKYRRSNDHKTSSHSTRTNQWYNDSERKIVSSRESEKFDEPRFPNRSDVRDSSLSEEDFALGERSNSNLRDQIYQNSRIPKNPRSTAKDFPGLDSRDSSISITEDENEECYARESRLKNLRTEKYDSSVSITEDERGSIPSVRKYTWNYYPEKSFTSFDESRAGTNNVPGERFDDSGINDLRNERKSSMKYYQELESRPIESEKRDVSHQIISRKVSMAARPSIDENHGNGSDVSNIHGNRNTANDFSQGHQEDSAYLSVDGKRHKISDPVRELGIADSKQSDGRSDGIELKRNLEARLLTPAKVRIQQMKKKPVVVSSEPVNFDIREYDRSSTRKDHENDMNANNTSKIFNARTESMKSSNDQKNTPSSQKVSTESFPQSVKNLELANDKSKKKETTTKDRDDGTKTKETNEDNAKGTSIADEKPIAEFGSETNPKQLIAWVPAVICEDDDGAKCRLVFEGKLLNEAGHVANRKFTTDFVKRRINPKLIETSSHIFYQLVGDLNDTKHVVPKDLLKLCHTGCPSKINHFCERWKLLSSANVETPPKERSHTTSLEALSVPTSSRGRRILPPLNYWTGERVTTKDNRAVYSPGNCEESSISTSLDKTNEEAPKRQSPKGHKRRDKPAAELAAIGAKKKDAEKISPPDESMPGTKSSPNNHGSQRLRSVKRRLAKKMHDSSTESDDGEPKTKIPLRKRGTKTRDTMLKTETTLTRKLRNSSKSTTFHQSPEKTTSLRSNSFEKPAEMDIKSKLRKRAKINHDEAQIVIAGTSKQLTSRESSEITCTLYKNVPAHDGDLSEDQLSTM